MMREMLTRFGREGLGFLWLVGEPLLFCFGVIVLWTVIKPEYEHGIRVAAFVMTGYMCLLLTRHMISYNLTAVTANTGLLHHRPISILHIYASRNMLEFLGGTTAFVVVYTVLFCIGQVSLPHNLLLMYGGWMILVFLSVGFGLVFSALAVQYELMEKLINIIQYLMIPMTGTFFMVGWFPEHIRRLILLIPFPNAVEMVRGGVFGEFVPTYYHPLYAVTWAAGLNLLGLLLLANVKDRVDVEG
ncbi:MAG: ABC transporter [Caulobacteraceae bacterium]|nr:ABC transporter [Caulobacteraceae bacterium]